MYSIILEVKSNDPQCKNIGFYNPAPDEYRKFPRTNNGITKAVKQLIKLAYSKGWITNFQLKIYEGKYEYWKPLVPFAVITKDTILKKASQ